MDTVFLIVAIFHLLVFVIGVPGNLLILQVFGRKTRKTSTNVFIMALASADIMACLLRPVFVGYYTVYHVTGEFPSIWIEIVYFTLNLITVYSSTLLTAAIAFDRYDAVCRPHTRLLSYRGAQGLAVGCFIASLPMTVPTVLIYYNKDLSVRLAKPALTLVAYVMALLLVLVFYIRVYKAVLFRTKGRTKWGGRFAGISTAGETSVTVTGQTEVSALPPAAHKPGSPPGPPSENHEGGERPVPPYPGPTAETAIVCVSDKDAVVYHNPDNPPATTYPDAPPEYSTLLPGGSPPGGPAAAAGPSSNTVSYNVPIRTYSQPPPASGNAERSGSTVRQRTASEKGKPTKTVAARMQNRTTRMLLLTTIVFFVTWIPYVCLSPMQMYVALTRKPLNSVLVGIVLNAAYLLYVNSAANPFIYVLANRQFRNDCKRELRKLWRSCSRR